MAVSNGTLRSRVAAVLGVEAGEGRAIGLMAGLYFALACGFVFVQTTAFGLFIDEYGARNLPFAYLSIAIAASFLAFLYLKLSERLALRTLLFANLAFLAAVCLVFWLGLRSHLAHCFIFFLPLIENTPAAERLSRWATLCALHVAGVMQLRLCEPAVRALSILPDPVLSRLSCWSLAEMGFDVPV